MNAAQRAPWLQVVGDASAKGEEPTDDAELVSRALASDRWAEEALYRRHAPRVLNTAVRLLGRHDDADDIVQDTFVVAFTRLGSLKDGHAFRAWVTRIAVNLVRQRIRRRSVLKLLSLDRGPDDAALPILAVEGTRPDLRAELAELDRILRAQPAEQRIAWHLHRVEGWSLRETAELVRCSVATVKRRIAATDSAVDVHRTGRGGSR